MPNRPVPTNLVRTAVLGGFVVAVALLIAALAEVTIPFIFALIIAFVLTPPVNLLRSRLRLPRPVAAPIVYLAFLGILIGIGFGLAPVIAQQAASLIENLEGSFAEISGAIEAGPIIAVGDFQIDLASALDNPDVNLEAALGQLATGTLGLATQVFSLAAAAILTLFIGFYLLLDGERISRYIHGLIPSAYRDDVERMLGDLSLAIKTYLFFQLLLAVIVWIITTLILLALGVPNAFILGLLAGILEVVPIIGPILASIPAIILALFQGSLVWPIEGIPFALLVAGAYIVIQQIEGNVLIPQIMGRGVNLHPVVIIFGILAGASLAGIIGIFLAAPLIASLRIIAGYIKDWLFPPADAETIQSGSAAGPTAEI